MACLTNLFFSFNEILILRSLYLLGFIHLIKKNNEEFITFWPN